MKTALIAAVVSAVVAAASGTAATLVVTSKNIKDGTIQTVDLSAKAKKALKGKRGARGARGAAGPQGAQGPQGPQGIQGPAGVQRIKLIVSAPVNVPPTGASVEASATCPPGETAVSGGFGLDGSDAGVHHSFGNGSSWLVRAENAGPAPATVSAFAYCSPGVAFQP
jgi:hypothetical protein